MGIPYNNLSYDEQELYSTILKNSDIDITVIQNKNDDRGNIEDVIKMLRKVGYNLIMKESDNHRYNYPQDLLQIMNNIRA